MSGKTLTRAGLVDALFREVGLSKDTCARLLEAVLAEIGGHLVAGDAVRIQNFGVFSVRQKSERIGRNPRTGEAAPINARRVVVFRAAGKLRDAVNQRA